MKKSEFTNYWKVVALLITWLPSLVLAQEDEEDLGDFRGASVKDITESKFEGGLSYTNIGGENYVGLTLNPELSIWKLGVGVDVPLLVNLDDGSFRSEVYKNGTGFLRLIRYVRFGRQKKDPIYVKWGELNNTMIGYGGLINNYSNAISQERRKVGLHWDVNFNEGMFGIEGMYSDLDPKSLNLLALRPYVRPFSKMPIPIVSTIEVGFTYIQDRDQTIQRNARRVNDSTFEDRVYAYTEPGISAFGFDMGVTLLKIPFVKVDGFAQWSKLNVKSDTLDAYFALDTVTTTLSDGFKNGSGMSFGINARFNFIANIFMMDLRIERLWYDEHYIPQFFDANYEIDKDRRIELLGGTEKKAGIYGNLQGHILNMIQVGGSLMIPDEIDANNPAMLIGNADLDNLMDKFSLHGRYQKGNLADLSDAFKFDENSQVKLRVAYHVNDFLRAGVDYFWTFVRVEEDGVTKFKADGIVSPYFGFSMTF